MPNCLICGKFCKMLNSHIERTHKTKIWEYRDKFGFDTPLAESSVREKQNANRFQPWSVQNVAAKNGIQESEAELKIKEKRQQVFSSQTSVWSVQFWQNKGLSIEEAKKEVSKRQTRSLERYIKKYGETEGVARFREKHIQQGLHSNKEYLLASGMSEEDIRFRKDNFSIPTLMKKYDIDEAAASLLRNKRTKNLLQYFSSYFWTRLGYQYEESVSIVSKLQSRNVDWWKNKYPDDWEERYIDYVKRSTSGGQHGKRIQKESTLFFAPLVDFCDKNGIKYTKEKFISCDCKCYYIDLVIDELKLAFEYDGAAFHPDPENVNHQWKQARQKKTYAECIELENVKNNAISKCGYTLIRIHQSRKDNFDLIKILKEHYDQK